HGLLELRIAAEVLSDLKRLAAAHGQIDDDRVGVEGFGLNPGLEAAMSEFVLVLLIVGKEFLHPINEELLGSNDQDFVPALLFEFTQRHAVFLEEPDQVLAGNAPVLAAGDAVAAEPAGVEPLAPGAGRDFSILRALRGGKDFFHWPPLQFPVAGPPPPAAARAR